MWPRRVGLLLMAPPTALLQFWIQAAHDGGHTLDAMAAIAAFFFWAGIVRGFVAPGEPAVAVTTSGVFNGTEFYRWEEIGSLSMLDEDTIVLTVNGRPRFLELPHTDLTASAVFGVLKYYLDRPRERALIASGW